ncbi:MAG: porin [Bacteroidia bacterium]|nr:porin [Bacteroidia bacterium]
MRRHFFAFSTFVLTGFFGQAQVVTDSIKTKAEPAASESENKLSISGYVEAYYNYGIGAPKAQMYQPYFYNFARQNEVSLNLAYAKLAYADDKIRGTLSLMTGNYAQYNLAAEASVFQNLYEGFVGFKLNKNVWIDAGVFSSHIGCESAIGKDNFNLTRSFIAENSPYYETGVKLTHDRGKKWLFTFLLLNGWQNMRETNTDKAAGWHIEFKPNSKLTLYSCSFAGNEKADTAKQYRLFHDFDLVYNASDKFSFMASFDYGMEQKAKGDTTAGDWNNWFGGCLEAKISPWKKVSIGLRAEQYNDKNGVIISKTTKNGFQTSGLSANVDVKPHSNVMWRTEIRYLNSLDDIFLNSKSNSTHINLTAVTSINISF